MASEALGLSDIGVIVEPKDFGSVDADDYLFHEDGEKIFFLIKSKKDEYCFTNFGIDPCGRRLGRVFQALHQAL